MRSAVAFLLVLLSSSVVHAAITGTIVTDEGAPIAGASIRAFAAESSRDLRQRLLSAPNRNVIRSRALRQARMVYSASTQTTASRSTL